MKRFFGVILLCIMVMICGGCGTRPGGLGWQGNITWQYTDTAMGTVIQQIIYADEDEAAQDFSHQVMRMLSELENQHISWRKETSELARLNATAGTGESFEVSPELSEILGRCLDVSEASGGAFDITIGSVVRLWNIDSWAAGEQEGSFVVPDATAIEAAVRNAGYHRIGNTGQTASSACMLPEGMQLDLGAVGKGIALGKIHELLKTQSKIQAAVISAGGSVLTYGRKPDGMTWKVGIVDPGNTSQNIAVLSLDGGWYVATSGDYERYVEVDGVRYHHIIDPTTGYPADSNIRSVTIISRDGLLSDALSTACFVLGVEEGMRLAKEYEVEALFVLNSGEVVMSEGMTEDFSGTIIIKSESK